MSKLFKEIRWIAQIAILVFLAMALFTYSVQDPSWNHDPFDSLSVHNLTGLIGAWVADFLLSLFGLSAYWLVVLMGFLVIKGYRRVSLYSLGAEEQEGMGAGSIFIFLSLLLLSSGFEAIRLWSLSVDLPYSPGGVIGGYIGYFVQSGLGFTGGTLFLLFALTMLSSLLFRFSWLHVAEKVGGWVFSLFAMLRRHQEVAEDRKLGEVAAVERKGKVDGDREWIGEHKPIAIIQPIKTEVSPRLEKEKQVPLFTDLPSDTQLPLIGLLDQAKMKNAPVSAETLEFTSRLIEKKLKDFGVEVSVIAAYPGPVITRYEVEPAVGVKGSQIVNLSRDLARSLSLVSLRVVETVPDKNCMALELPNSRRQIVSLSDIIGSQIYADSRSCLTLGLGKDISGTPVCVDLAKMPHLLVAGTTGSGKSVGINAMILSLLYKATPEQVRLIMIDPKMLELSVYEGIPHLLCPVVTDMKKAAHALNWCVDEMEKRYQLMAKLGVRNLASFNQKVIEAESKGERLENPFSLTPEDPEPLQTLPYIVVVIDELADMMMIVGKKVEELIARIAQKARAAGIHLILATQRPSVDVITGLIKANVPTRIAFQVSSKIDSRTILDQMGAESLLGQGDMLFLPPGVGYPQRVHGAFVSDEEVLRVVRHLKEQGEAQYVSAILDPAEAVAELDGGKGEEDPLYDQAVEIVLTHKRASISLVQRHLRIGYNRAARLLEQMEYSGLVSSMSNSGTREVLAPDVLRE